MSEPFESLDDNIFGNEESDLEYYYVDNSTRFLNFFLDIIFSSMALSAFGFFVASGLSGLEEGSSSFERGTNYLLFVIYLLIIPSYYFIGEYFFQATLGKAITGTIVVKQNGEKPSALQVLGRTACRYIPFEPFSFLGSINSGWHDTLTNTLVVKKSFKKES